MVDAGVCEGLRGECHLLPRGSGARGVFAKPPGEVQVEMHLRVRGERGHRQLFGDQQTRVPL